MQYLVTFTFLVSALIQVFGQTNLLPPFLFGRSTRNSFFNHHERIHYANIHGLDALLQKEAQEAANPPSYPNIKEDWITQKVDHFNSSDTRTWSQRIQSNSIYFNKTDGQSVIFLMLGGEGMAEAKLINDDYQWVVMGKNQSAQLYQLEHRFFGPSQPFNTTGSLSFPNLQYLTPEQALEDMAVFVTETSKKFSNPKWILFGVAMERYANLFAGGICSSAIVKVQTDYFGYAQGVQDSVKTTSMDCYNAVNASFIQLQQLSLSFDGRNKLTKVFNIQPPLADKSTQLDITNFLSGMFGIFQSVIQYTFDGQNKNTENGLSVAGLCKVMTMIDNKNPDPIFRLQALNDWYNAFYGVPKGAPIYNDYWGTIKQLSVTDWNLTTNSALEARGWMALCCANKNMGIGFLQTTDQGRNIFGSIIPLNYYIDMCTDMFDSTVSIDYINSAVERGKTYFGASNYNGTYVVLPTGSLDEWTRSVPRINNTATQTYSILIEGIGHCGDMYPTYKNEPTGLANARTFIQGQVTKYVARSMGASSTISLSMLALSTAIAFLFY
uniref:Serine carboxypeptidase n=1 Tax=Rhabditophanes sp. KR3021 TaxID=114890 RepID=A0AC35TIC8_9BILA